MFIAARSAPDKRPIRSSDSSRLHRRVNPIWPPNGGMTCVECKYDDTVLIKEKCRHAKTPTRDVIGVGTFRELVRRIVYNIIGLLSILSRREKLHLWSTGHPTSEFTTKCTFCPRPFVCEQVHLPRITKTDFGRCAFSSAAPKIWNYILYLLL